MILDRDLYQKVMFSFRKNSSKTVIAFLMMFSLMVASYFALFFLVLVFSRVPVMVYPLLYVFLYVITCFFFGFDLLIYLLYCEKRAVLGHILLFFKDYKRMLWIAFLYFVGMLVIGTVSFLPYYFFADKTLDMEILGFAMAQDLDSLSHLEHGFSTGFYLFLALWFVLVCYFLFTFGFVPVLLYEHPNDNVPQILKKDLQLVYTHFIPLFALCFRVCIIPFLVLLGCFGVIILGTKFTLVKYIATLCDIIYPVSIAMMLMQFLFALAGFYNKATDPLQNIKVEILDVKNDETKTLLLDSPKGQSDGSVQGKS